MTTPSQDPEADRINQEWADALGKLSEEDERLLTLLRLMGQAVDPRYEMKAIRLLVARTLVDPAFRARALEDGDAALEDLRGNVDLPEDLRVRCVENSADRLTIVLPPPTPSMSDRSQSIRDLVMSRISADCVVLEAAGRDDNDILPFHSDFGQDSGTPHADHSHWGDPSTDG